MSSYPSPGQYPSNGGGQQDKYFIGMPGRASLFDNAERKQGNANAPDWNGKFTAADGVEYWCSFWWQQPKSGGAYYCSMTIGQATGWRYTGRDTPPTYDEALKGSKYADGQSAPQPQAGHQPGPPGGYQNHSAQGNLDDEIPF